MSEEIKIIEGLIEERQKYLSNMANVLARAGKARRITAASIKVMTIVFGAFAATSGVAAKFYGDSPYVPVVYTIVGLAIAAIGGLDAAFKYGERATELNRLAAECETVISQANAERMFSLISHNETSSVVSQARNTLETLNTCINETRKKVIDFGLHIDRFAG